MYKIIIVRIITVTPELVIILIICSEIFKSLIEVELSWVINEHGSSILIKSVLLILPPVGNSGCKV